MSAWSVPRAAGPVCAVVVREQVGDARERNGDEAHAPQRKQDRVRGVAAHVDVARRRPEHAEGGARQEQGRGLEVRPRGEPEGGSVPEQGGSARKGGGHRGRFLVAVRFGARGPGWV